MADKCDKVGDPAILQIGEFLYCTATEYQLQFDKECYIIKGLVYCCLLRPKKIIIITAFFHALNVKLAQYSNTLHYYFSC